MCADADIAVTLPKLNTTGMVAQGKFGKYDFALPGRAGCVSAGQLSAYWLTMVDGERTIRHYATKSCGSCPIKARCTTAKNISRGEHEARHGGPEESRRRSSHDAPPS